VSLVQLPSIVNLLYYLYDADSDRILVRELVEESKQKLVVAADSSDALVMKAAMQAMPNHSQDSFGNRPVSKYPLKKISIHD
jgi:hypothetical protein